MNTTKCQRRSYSQLSHTGTYLIICGMLVSVFIACGCEMQSRKNISPNGVVSAQHFTLYGSPADHAQRERNADYYTDDESYDKITENQFQLARVAPLSTFSTDVDTASYSIVRRYIDDGQLPPPDAVRIEEMINYFSYNYDTPAPDPAITPSVDTVTADNESELFSTDVVIADCPWNENHRLARIGIKAKDIDMGDRKSANLVFLIDVSGSMEDYNKLPLLKKSLNILIKTLDKNDRIGIVVYAGDSRIALKSTTCKNKDKIYDTINQLQAEGSTNGGAGIQQAYEMARDHYKYNRINRVILVTDGDFNVGITDQDKLVKLVEEKANAGIYLTVLGFGMGNYKDSTLEKLADKGNGNYAYIDTIHEGRKILVDQLQSTLITVAKDTKIQIEFNPREVNAYRLIGYENRMLAAQDFNDDTKDAGEIGAGHTVTALYEIVPAGVTLENQTDIDKLKYQNQFDDTSYSKFSREMFTLKIRYKNPESNTSELLEYAFSDKGKSINQTDDDFRFAAAVASFGMILRGSNYKGNSNYTNVISLARNARGEDAHGYRSEFVKLVETAGVLEDSDNTNKKNDKQARRN